MYLRPFCPGDKEQELTDWDKIKGYPMSNDGFVKQRNAGKFENHDDYLITASVFKRAV